MTADILSTQVICKEPGRYIGWPTVCRTRAGELLAVFSGDRDEHVCPWGKVQLVRSADDGATWSPPATICNHPLDDRDAGIIETRRGTLVVAWFTSLAFEGRLKGDLTDKPVFQQWRQHAAKLSQETRERWLGSWTVRSEDGGRTWDTPARTFGSGPHGMIELADGRLLYVGRRLFHPDTVLSVEESRDDGRSWQRIAAIEVAPEDNIHDFHEPHVVECADGRLVAQFRYHFAVPGKGGYDNLQSYLRQAVSEDGGRTWTVARQDTPPRLSAPPDPPAQRLAAQRLREALPALRRVRLHQPRRRPHLGYGERRVPARRRPERRPRLPRLRRTGRRQHPHRLLPSGPARREDLPDGHPLAHSGVTATMERYVAIDNVCAWPNLTLLPGGDLVATIFNQPSHGGWEGDVECWASADGGRIWTRRGTPAPHEPATNRMNVAAGLAADGALLVLASGWSNRPEPGTHRGHRIPDESDILPMWVCRSADQGRTWTRSNIPLPPPVPELTRLIPFGDIVPLADGTLGVCIYSWSPATNEHHAYFYASADDGRSWTPRGTIRTENINETTPVVLPDGRILLAARTLGDQHLDLLVSADHGATWECRGPLTLGMQHPGNLLLLRDGKILLTYGIRNAGLYGVSARISADGGATWTPPRVLVDFATATDGGYPASLELADGTLVTAYYCNRTPAHQRYHMGVLRWRLDEK